MSKKPDLGAMAMPKSKAAAMVPFSETGAPEASGAPKSLTIKLDGPIYSALRQYCHQKEIERGSRVTHQEVVVTALKTLLGIGT